MGLACSASQTAAWEQVNHQSNPTQWCATPPSNSAHSSACLRTIITHYARCGSNCGIICNEHCQPSSHELLVLLHRPTGATGMGWCNTAGSCQASISSSSAQVRCVTLVVWSTCRDETLRAHGESCHMMV